MAKRITVLSTLGIFVGKGKEQTNSSFSLQKDSHDLQGSSVRMPTRRSILLILPGAEGRRGDHERLLGERVRYTLRDPEGTMALGERRRRTLR